MYSTKKFLNGTLSTILLAILKEHGRMYGYEICQHTSAITEASINLTEGAIYPALHRLEKDGLLISSKEIVNGRTRKYYSVNVTSLEEISTQINMLSQFAGHLQSLLKPTAQ